jgi:hypothetical protein
MSGEAGSPHQAAESGWSRSEDGGVVERAELTFVRSEDLAALPGPWDVGDLAIDLLRAASHDESTLRHALRIGRSRVRRDPADPSARRGIRLLEAVIAFLGPRQRADEAVGLLVEDNISLTRSVKELTEVIHAQLLERREPISVGRTGR